MRILMPHVALVCAVLLIVHLALPALWGSPGLGHKLDHVVQADRPYDRVFVGSSHLYRQVLPDVLDSALGDGKRSFNAALSAIYSPESEIVCERILRAEHPPAEVFLELMPYVEFEERSFDHYRSWYYMDLPNTALLIRHEVALPGPDACDKLTCIGCDLRAFAYAATKPGLHDRLFGEGKVIDTASVMGPLGDGHLPFEWQESRRPGGNVLRARAEALAADTSVIGRRAHDIAEVYKGDAPSALSPVHLQRIRDLLHLADQRGVRLYFILPPLWPVTSEEVASLLDSLPEDRRIDLSDPGRFPAFYRLENIFDAGHLNEKGARLFTLCIAERLRAAVPGNPADRATL